MSTLKEELERMGITLSQEDQKKVKEHSEEWQFKKWSFEDVLMVMDVHPDTATPLQKARAKEVLKRTLDNHDSQNGINWQTIEDNLC